ncbi:RNA polymerase sigma factor [Actinoplanes siamensis]|uniref:RNA polymerase sigma factor 70 region 4 type 2 domain-containing protein n=1 Tax=Actinoplanes siamensis TaxID=1223317 RepID=A0A919TKP3_9ACTN|nr:sigma-70 family RNA polymerase sigma factor [Actinoplanes siamensis]GIF05528.1 hypothetical protein Asi03nite_30660 [Actinoplanes siamensis]
MSSDERSQADGEPALQVWTAGDQAQWETFFEKSYEPLVAAGVWWGASHQDAEDAAEHALEEIRRRWHQIHNHAAYARRIVFNHLNGTKAKDRRGLRGLFGKHVYVSDGCDDRQLTAYEEKQWIVQLLRRLPPAQRAVMARIYDGWSGPEIARQLGMSEPAVRKNLQLARERLKRELERQRAQESGGPVRRFAPPGKETIR